MLQPWRKAYYYFFVWLEIKSQFIQNVADIPKKVERGTYLINDFFQLIH